MWQEAGSDAKLRPPTQPEVERRLIGRALAQWDVARRGERLPSRASLASDRADSEAANQFLIEVGAHEYDDRIVEAGRDFVLALGLDPVGKRVIDVLPSAVDRGLSFCRVAVELKKPIADVGRFTNSQGLDVLYRSALLPLSDDQLTVNYVLGAFSYRFAR